MNTPNEAYLLAEHIHSSFFGPNATLPKSDVRNSQVKSVVGSSSSRISLRIEASGIIDGEPSLQTLAKSKSGTYYLSTVSVKPNSPHRHTSIHPNTSFEAVELLVGTLFMSRLVAIAQE